MQWLDGLRQSSSVLLVMGGALVLAAVLSFWMHSASVYVAIATMLAGVLGVMVSCVEIHRATARVMLSVLAIFGGAIYLMLFCLLALQRLAQERKKQRTEIARRLQYTLPQRENSYIRERLTTALQPIEGAQEEVTVRLGYARELLGKVQSAPLTVAERLQMEEIGKIFTLYKGKTTWTPDEVNGLNETCAMLLKLSAKYAV